MGWSWVSGFLLFVFTPIKNGKNVRHRSSPRRNRGWRAGSRRRIAAEKRSRAGGRRAGTDGKLDAACPEDAGHALCILATSDITGDDEALPTHPPGPQGTGAYAEVSLHAFA